MKRILFFCFLASSLATYGQAPERDRQKQNKEFAITSRYSLRLGRSGGGAGSRKMMLGQSASYLQLGGGYGIKNKGVGLTFEIDLNHRKKKQVLNVGYHHYFAYNRDFVEEIGALNNGEPDLDLKFTQSVSFRYLHISAKRYFIGNFKSTVGFYGAFGGGLMFAPIKYTIENYDKSRYEPFDLEDELLSHVMLKLNLGLDVKFPFGLIFIEPNVNLPTNEHNGQPIVIEIPASLTFDLGVRFNL